MANMQKQYTLARNELHFSMFRTGTMLPAGFRYIGNTPSFSLASEPENLDHFDADHGLRVKDDSVTLELARTASFETDNINVENLAGALLANYSVLVQEAAVAQTYAIPGALAGHSYQIGLSVSNPTGVRSLANFVLAEDIEVSPATYVLNTDYRIDVELGRLEIIAGGAITDGTGVEATYDLTAVSRDRIVAGTDVSLEGSLQVISYNAKGPQRDYLIPYVKLTPNGEINLKGDEWQIIPFSLEILSPGDGRAPIYVDGRPYVVV